MKVFWLIVGLIFFICWPISSLYPKYRLLVSPIKWGFWNVPTHGEWSFKYLQEHSVNVIRKIEEKKNESPLVNAKVSTSQPADASPQILINNDDDNGIDEEDDDCDSMASFDSAQSFMDASVSEILHFRCVYQRRPGRLILTPTGFHWRSSLMRNTDRPSKFYHAYHDIVEMSKKHASANVLSPIIKFTTTMDQLELRVRVHGKYTDQQGSSDDRATKTILLENMTNRDKAFNTILGFSGLQWQNLEARKD
jgi:hypothetical protein